MLPVFLHLNRPNLSPSFEGFSAPLEKNQEKELEKQSASKGAKKSPRSISELAVQVFLNKEGKRPREQITATPTVLPPLFFSQNPLKKSSLAPMVEIDLEEEASGRMETIQLTKEEAEAEIDDVEIAIQKMEVSEPMPHSIRVIAHDKDSSESILKKFKTILDFCHSLERMHVDKGGVNGVYLLKDKDGENTAVFKPAEAEGDKRPGDDGQLRIKWGLRHGDTPMHECAAYYLGSKYRISLPATAFLSLESQQFETGEGNGSVQEFKKGISIKTIPQAELNRIVANMSLSDLHELYMMDLLTGNTDRHKGNLLLDGNQFVKIDHGCCLAASLANEENYCWLKWDVPALHTPFDLSQFGRFNWVEDVAQIQKVFPNFSSEALAILRLRMHLIQEGTKKGLTPLELAQFFGKFNAMSALYEKSGITSIHSLEAIERMEKRIDAKIDAICQRKKSKKAAIQNMVGLALSTSRRIASVSLQKVNHINSTATAS